jgi:hypothetical protein
LKGLLATALVPGFADKLMPQLPPAPQAIPVAETFYRDIRVTFTYTETTPGGEWRLIKSWAETVKEHMLDVDMQRTARAFGGSVTKSPALYARGVYRLLGSTAPQAVLYHQPGFEWSAKDALTASNARGFAKGGKESIVLDLDKARLDASLSAAHPCKDANHADVTRTLL